MKRALAMVLLLGCSSPARPSAMPGASAPRSRPAASTPRPIGRMLARVVGVAQEPCTGCGGAHIFLEVVVDGRAKILHAGGHCAQTTLAVGSTVVVDARFFAASKPDDDVEPCMRHVPAIDGSATIVVPPDAVTGQ